MILKKKEKASCVFHRGVFDVHAPLLCYKKNTNSAHKCQDNYSLYSTLFKRVLYNE